MDECLILQRTYSKTKLKIIQSDHPSRISRSPNSRISRSGPGWFYSSKAKKFLLVKEMQLLQTQI